MKSNNIYTIVTNAEQNIIYVNSYFLVKTGFDESTLINKPIKTILNIQENLLNDILIATNNTSLPTTIKTPSAEERFIDWYVTKTFDFKNNFSGLIFVGVDITEQKLAEQKYKETYQELLTQYELYKDLNLQLIKAKKQAEESDELKSALLSNLSHEIRTPMNAIIGFSELLLNKDVSKEKAIEFIQIINKNSKDLLQTLDDIILLSKIQSGQIALKKEPCNLHFIINSIINHQNIKNFSTVNFIVTDNYKDLIISCDEQKIRTILYHIIKNACYYSQKGTIKIDTFLENEHECLITIKDEGIGISDEEKNKIFEPFYRGYASRQKSIRGLGLGLTIVKKLVELLNGQLWFESNPEQGTIFFIKFPIEILYHEQKICTSNIDCLKNKRILIVEDEIYNYQYIETILKESLCIIDHAKNGIEAIEKSNSTQYDLILMDLRLPIMNGIEASTKIKSSQPKSKIIAVSAFNDSDTINEALNAGCIDFISKPFDKNTLINLMCRYV